MLSVLAVAVPAAAQNPTPTAAVSVTCAPISINVEVKPGSTYSGFTTCTATNPTAYQEKISILESVTTLQLHHPGHVHWTDSSVDFQVSVRAIPYMEMTSRTLSVQQLNQEIKAATD